MKDLIKRYAISSLITFVSVFGLVFLTGIQVNDFDFSKGSFIALIASAAVVAVRAFAKVVIELIMIILKDLKK